MWFQGRHQPALGLGVLILATAVFHFGIQTQVGLLSSVVYFLTA